MSAAELQRVVRAPAPRPLRTPPDRVCRARRGHPELRKCSPRAAPLRSLLTRPDAAKPPAAQVAEWVRLRRGGVRAARRARGRKVSRRELAGLGGAKKGPDGAFWGRLAVRTGK